MPIETNSDAWQEADYSRSVRDDILEFLRENPDKAYATREIADEVSDTGWEEVHDEEREIQRVGEEQYYEENPDSTEPGSTIVRQLQTGVVATHVSALVYEGHVQVKKVGVEDIGFPVDWDSVKVYSYSGE